MPVVHTNGWKLDPARCPCDIDFVSYLQENQLSNKNIFHMGTGLHHIVGIQGAKLCNRVTAITNVDAEWLVYCRMNIRRPDITRWYQVIYGNIYEYQWKLPRSFHIVNLFHLGEMIEPSHPGPELVINDFIDRLSGNGKIILYKGSAAFDRMEPIIERMEQRGLKNQFEYKSLLICAS